MSEPVGWLANASGGRRAARVRRDRLYIARRRGKDWG